MDILSIIHGDVIEAAVAQCEATLRAKADTSPEAVRKMLNAFGELGVTREQIEVRIQRRIDAILPALMVALRKIYTSIRDGMSSPAVWFVPCHEHEPQTQQAEPAAEALKRKLQERRAAERSSSASIADSMPLESD